MPRGAEVLPLKWRILWHLGGKGRGVGRARQKGERVEAEVEAGTLAEAGAVGLQGGKAGRVGSGHSGTEGQPWLWGAAGTAGHVRERRDPRQGLPGSEWPERGRPPAPAPAAPSRAAVSLRGSGEPWRRPRCLSGHRGGRRDLGCTAAGTGEGGRQGQGLGEAGTPGGDRIPAWRIQGCG